MLKFELWDKKNKEMLGPFFLKDITTYERKPILKKDNRVIEIEEIGPRYLAKEVKASEKLKEMLDEQDELDKRIIKEKVLNWGNKVNHLNSLCTAISNETEELRDTAAWKWWSEDMGADWDESREELIDIFHFWLSAANLLGMDASDIYNKYMDKNEVNHCRQDGDY